ncbi:MAG: O-antigen ligase family protein [Bacteroidales bacterium]|jgi:hypothetical protein|nr:O-antigen ligase family protein [Bacteroidales bacterium]
MNYFVQIFKELYYYTRGYLNSPARWMLIMFALWIYRVSVMPAVAGGIAQGLQIGTLFGMLFFAIKWNPLSISFGLFRTGMPVLTMTFYLLLGMLSTLWSYKPDYSLFMSFEKLAFLAIFFALFTIPQTFLATEKFVVMLMFGSLIFNWFAPRVAGYQGFMGHDLQEGSCAAMLVAYCVGELLSDKVASPMRKPMFRVVIIVGILCLFTSTSGGANASAALGVAIAFLVSGRIVWALAFALGGALLMLNDAIYDKIFNMLMQGKSQNDIQTATGRTAIWSALTPLAEQKPMLGWGYAAIERYMTDTGIMRLTDVHSNFYGAYGGTGIVGLTLLIIHHVAALLYAFRNALRPGFAGVICALAAGTMNGYSYGYLAGKTAIITVFYLAFVMLTFIYTYVPVEQNEA